jgi:peptide/nickel transport system permease protein
MVTASRNTPSEMKDVKRKGLLAEAFTRLIKEKPLGVVSGVIVLIIILVAIFADIVAPYGMNEVHLSDAMAPPSTKYLLGTDNLGRDVFSRVVYGARISVAVGLGASFLNTLITAVIGIVSGFFGGKVDLVIQRFVDSVMAFPALLLYLIFMSLAGGGVIQVILVLGIISGVRWSRTIRGAVIRVVQDVYVDAARAIGSPAWRTMLRHVLPNIMPPLLIVFTVTCGYMILSEATLSFLGFGIPPPDPSWGGMLSGSGRKYMYLAPWMALWPGVALALTIYGLNMLGDAVRDILDPRLRGGLGRYGGVKVKRPRTDMEQKQSSKP